MSDWTPEPWEVVRNGTRTQIRSITEPQYHIGDVDDANGPSFRRNDADRIIACVNACAGIPTECLGDDDWKTLMAVRKEREALRASLRDMTEYAQEYAIYMDSIWCGHRKEQRDIIHADIAKARGLLK